MTFLPSAQTARLPSSIPIAVILLVRDRSWRHLPPIQAAIRCSTAGETVDNDARSGRALRALALFPDPRKRLCLLTRRLQIVAEQVVVVPQVEAAIGYHRIGPSGLPAAVR